MSFFQPTKCKCFGGYCWGQFCVRKEKAKSSKHRKTKFKKRDTRVWHPKEDKDDQGHK